MEGFIDSWEAFWVGLGKHVEAGWLGLFFLMILHDLSMKVSKFTVYFAI